MRKLLLACAAVLIALTSTASSSRRADAQSPSGPSAQVVRGVIGLPNNEVGAFTVRDLALLAIRNERDGIAYAFSPSITSANSVAWLPLRVTQSEVTQIPGDNGKVEEPKPMSLGEVIPFHVDGWTFQLKAQSVDPIELEDQPTFDLSSASNPQEILETHLRSGSGTCCITCRPWTICAADVELPCGSCTVKKIDIPGTKAR